MRTVRLHAYGDIDQFHVEDLPTPVPGPGEVLIKLSNSAVNHFDLLIRQGYLAQMIPLEFPVVLGLDGAGFVTAVGPDVSAVRVGDRVVAHFPLGKGSHAEYALAPVAGVAKLPTSVSFDQGAALPTVGLTGREAVDALGVKRGDRVLVAGAFSAVGRVAMHYLREIGAIPTAGVLPNELAAAKAVGDAIDLTQTPATPTFDYAIIAVHAVENAIKYVRDGGKAVSTVQPPEGLNPNVTLELLFHHDNAAILQAVADAAGRGELQIPIASTFRLEELGKAHTALAAGPAGKIVLTH